MEPCSANVMVCADGSAVANEVARRFGWAALRSVEKRGVFHVAVPGGTSPRGAFELLCGPSYAALPWDRTHLFFTDERCVPPDHVDSNFRMVNDLLISGVPIPRENVHRFVGEMPPHEAAELYSEEIERVMGPAPRFDLIVLGVGNDAHTASLFPNSPALGEMHRIAVANEVAKLNAHRLTLTIPTLNNARHVIVLALGRDKASAVHISLQGAVDALAQPVQAVRPTNGTLVWIVDSDAALEL